MSVLKGKHHLKTCCLYLGIARLCVCVRLFAWGGVEELFGRILFEYALCFLGMSSIRKSCKAMDTDVSVLKDDTFMTTRYFKGSNLLLLCCRLHPLHARPLLLGKSAHHSNHKVVHQKLFISVMLLCQVHLRQVPNPNAQSLPHPKGQGWAFYESDQVFQTSPWQE